MYAQTYTHTFFSLIISVILIMYELLQYSFSTVQSVKCLEFNWENQIFNMKPLKQHSIRKMIKITFYL